MVHIGFETYSHQGPGIFLSRLKTALETQGCFDAENPDVWVQLSFQPLPDWVAERRTQGKTRVLIRMDGAYCGRSYKIRKPFFLPVPGLDDWYSAKVNRKKNVLIRENLLTADDIIFQSEFSQRITQRFVTPTQPGRIIYNGIDLDAFSPDGPRAELMIADRTNILMSHSFRPYHRLHDAMKIVAALKGQLTKPVHLWILGGDEGQSFAHAQTIAQGLGLHEKQDYTFLGKQPFEQLAPLYRGADCMLNLSYWDTCPNVLIEALACGLPVVGVDYGGVAELIGENGGIRVPERIPFTYIDHMNPQRMPQAPITAYVNAIRRVLENQVPIAQAARSRAEKHFDIRQVARQYIEAAQALTPVVV